MRTLGEGPEWPNGRHDEGRRLGGRRVAVGRFTSSSVAAAHVWSSPGQTRRGIGLKAGAAADRKIMQASIVPVGCFPTKQSVMKSGGMRV